MIIRNMCEEDIQNIVDLSIEYFMNRGEYLTKRYKEVLQKGSNTYTLVMETNEKEFVGFLRYNIKPWKEITIDKPKVAPYGNPETKTLYISAIAIKMEYRGNDLSTILINEALKHAEIKKCKRAMGIAVKDGVHHHVNARKMFDKFEFDEIIEISDPFEWASLDDNYCPHCNGVYKTCQCDGILYIKEF